MAEIFFLNSWPQNINSWPRNKIRGHEIKIRGHELKKKKISAMSYSSHRIFGIYSYAFLWIRGREKNIVADRINIFLTAGRLA
jgi:hypothetical protein